MCAFFHQSINPSVHQSVPLTGCRVHSVCILPGACMCILCPCACMCILCAFFQVRQAAGPTEPLITSFKDPIIRYAHPCTCMHILQGPNHPVCTCHMPRATCTRHMHMPHAKCTRHMHMLHATCQMRVPHEPPTPQTPPPVWPPSCACALSLCMDHVRKGATCKWRRFVIDGSHASFSSGDSSSLPSSCSAFVTTHVVQSMSEWLVCIC